MTRKHFQLIADALWASYPGDAQNTIAACERLQWRATVRCVADALATTNPRFDRARFIAAATRSK